MPVSTQERVYRAIGRGLGVHARTMGANFRLDAMVKEFGDDERVALAGAFEDEFGVPFSPVRFSGEVGPGALACMVERRLGNFC